MAIDVPRALPLMNTTMTGIERGPRAPLWVCYCDYDGVLHDDAVYWSRREGIHLRTPGRKLFEWAHILEELLAPYPGVTIVLSTSWVRHKRFEFSKHQLPLGLQSRVIGATFHSRETHRFTFDSMSRGMQIYADVARRRPAQWFAIDNDDHDWPTLCRDHLIKTDDRLGLSELAVQDQIRRMLASFKA
jgi:hypothetical protein